MTLAVAEALNPNKPNQTKPVELTREKNFLIISHGQKDNTAATLTPSEAG